MKALLSAQLCTEGVEWRGDKLFEETHSLTQVATTSYGPRVTHTGFLSIFPLIGRIEGDSAMNSLNLAHSWHTADTPLTPAVRKIHPGEVGQKPGLLGPN